MGRGMARDHIGYLDGWRGLAILAVLVGHFLPAKSINFGPVGVELFFVLSGRLMAEMLIVRQTPLGTFFWRRFSRIYPALLLFCSAMLVASIFSKVIGIRLPSSVGFSEYFAAIFFAMNYAASIFGMQGVLDHVWSLSVEEHSYAILAAVSFFSARNRKRSATIAAVLAVVMMFFGVLQALLTNQSEHQLYWRTDVRAASVFISFAFYILFDPLRKPGRKWSYLIAPLCLSAAIATNFDLFPIWLKYSVGTTLFAISINTVDWASAWVKRCLSGGGLVFIGALSYSLYLWQQPFYRLVSFVGWAPALLATFVVALGSYFIIEKPCRKTLNELWARRSRGAAKLEVETAA
jgi:peptidoglycan/LPS O-acetylase OafA/YrhL